MLNRDGAFDLCKHTGTQETLPIFFLFLVKLILIELIRPIERSGDVRAREPWEDPRGEAEGKGVVEKGCTERECPIGSISLPLISLSFRPYCLSLLHNISVAFTLFELSYRLRQY